MWTEYGRKAEKRKRAKNFCERDVKLLLSILRETDGGRLLEAVCSMGGKKEEIAFKDHAWLEVYSRFLTGGGDATFEVETLRTKFNNIKKMLKLKYSDQEWTGVKPEMLDPETFFKDNQKFCSNWKDDGYYDSTPKKYKTKLSERHDKPKRTAMKYKWVDYEASIGMAFQEMRLAQEGLDITFICEDGLQVHAHKVILAACSPFLRHIVVNIPHQHPFVYLKGIGSFEMEALLDFMYCGKTAVRPEFLKAFLDAAHDLKIKGLSTEQVQSSSFKDMKKGASVKEEPSQDKKNDDNTADKDNDSFVMEVEVEKQRKPETHDGDFDDDDDEDEDEEEDEDSDFEGLGDPQDLAGPGQNIRNDSDKGWSLIDVNNISEQHALNQQHPQGQLPPHQPHPQPEHHIHHQPHTSTLNQPLHQTTTATGMDHICQLCGKNFGSSAVALMVHQNRDHPTIHSTTESSIVQHQTTTTITIIKCDHCGKVFTGVDSLHEHIKEAHAVQLHH